MLDSAQMIARVRNDSTMLAMLSEINSRYFFHFDVKKHYGRKKVFSDKNKFNRYDCDDLLENVIAREYIEFAKIIWKIRDNSEQYRKYRSETDRLRSNDAQRGAERLGMPVWKYTDIESREYWNMIKTPVISSEIECIVQYISPKGKKEQSKTRVYPIEMIEDRYKQIQLKNERLSSRENKAKAERAKMSAKLRYQILQRDGFKCQICGRGAKDGVKLHVDHIIPVSKGGKTVPENLRTLCDQCNFGKGADI